MCSNEIEKKNDLVWFVYILCCADNTLYCGITKNIEERIEKHNGIRKGGAKYTSGRRPVELRAYAQVATRSEALLLELSIKKMPRDQKISFVWNYNAILL